MEQALFRQICCCSSEENTQMDREDRGEVVTEKNYGSLSGGSTLRLQPPTGFTDSLHELSEAECDRQDTTSLTPQITTEQRRSSASSKLPAELATLLARCNTGSPYNPLGPARVVVAAEVATTNTL